VKKTKKENGVDYPVGAYLYVPDPAKPETWKLRYKNYTDGKLKLDPEQLGKVVAAFSPGGFRGQKVEIPDADKKKMITKIRGIYTKTLKVKEADMPETLRVTQDMSFADIRSALWDAVQALNPNDDICIEDVYPDYVIYEQGDSFFKCSYSILDGVVTLGDKPVEVEETWIEAPRVAQDEEFSLILRLGQALNPEGSSWEVVICEPGFTKNGCYIPDEILRQGAAVQFEGLDVNLYDLPQGATHVPGPLFDIKSLLVKNKVGWLDTVRHVAGKGLVGIVHFLDSAKWLGKNMLEAMNQGKSIYGLSWDALIRGAQAVIEGKNVLRIDGFNRADSLDVVSRPAAGGKFIRAVAAMPAQNEEDKMKEMLLKLIQTKRPDLLNGKDVATITDQELEGLARMAMDVQTPAIDPKNIVTKDDLAVIQCGMALKDKLADTTLGLPPIALERIKKTFEGRVYMAADLDKAIADEKDYLAKISTVLIVDSIPAGSVTGGLGSYERACMAADRMFGLKKEDMINMTKLTTLDNKPFFTDVRNVQDYDEFDKVPAFSSIREMYTYFTGDPEVTGRFNRKALPPELRKSMDSISSATFTYVLGNTLGRRLVGIYRAIAYLEELLISVKKPVRDFRTQEAVLVGGFADLETVDPESGDYQEVAGVTDEESSYTIGQKGNILSITRKTIINDDISIIQRLINGLARAARRTHAKCVWGLYINNGTCTDGTAWFTAGHGNLGSTALSYVTALAGYKVLALTTEKDSGERLGLLSDPSVKPNLVGPVDLMETINKIATEPFYYTTNDLTNKTPNPLLNKITPVVNPLLTDTNDWGLLLPPQIADMVEMGYLNGREDPELFVADMPQSEQVFVADKIRHKIRHEYAGAVIDWRTGYKAVVA
jgi:hypothetical protein